MYNQDVWREDKKAFNEMFVRLAVCGALLVAAHGEREDFRRGIKVAGFQQPALRAKSG